MASEPHITLDTPWGPILVVSRRHTTAGEYIGRPGPLGNPFRVGDGPGQREEAVAAYAQWLAARMEGRKAGDRAVRTALTRIVGILKRNRRLVLACWCAPKLCHGSEVAKAAASLAGPAAPRRNLRRFLRQTLAFTKIDGIFNMQPQVKCRLGSDEPGGCPPVRRGSAHGLGL